MCISSRTLSIFLLNFLILPAAVAQTYTYRLTEIPLNQLSGSISYGTAINKAGQVTGVDGVCNNAGCRNSAFLWSGNLSGNPVIAHLNFFSDDPFEFTGGADVNDSGKVTGTYSTSGGPRGFLAQAFVWDGVKKTLLGTLGGEPSSGLAINAKGYVTGLSFTGDSSSNAPIHAFLWDGIEMRDLGTLGGLHSEGRDINNAGHVVGTSQNAQGNTRAFIWDGTAMRDLGSLGGNTSAAESINNKEQVVGVSTTELGFEHAFLWQNGLMQDLGTLPCCNLSHAFAINNSGQVVGFSGPPFLWENGKMRNVNSLIPAGDRTKVPVHEVLDINDAGQMLGLSFFSTGTKAYLISPVYKLSAFLAPTTNTWQRGSTVRIAIAALNANGVRIPDARAAVLIAQPGCRVKVSATGSQTLASTCMKYNATTNEFYFDWKLAPTGTGASTITARVNYGSPGPLKVLRTRNISVTN